MGEIKNGWKGAGKELGSAFKKFGKTLVKSTRTVVDKADNKCNESDKKTENPNVVDVKEVDSETETIQVDAEVADSPKESNVFNDGSWKEVGKGLGKGFGGVGKMIGKTISKPFKKDKKSKQKKTQETDIKQIE